MTRLEKVGLSEAKTSVDGGRSITISFEGETVATVCYTTQEQVDGGAEHGVRFQFTRLPKLTGEQISAVSFYIEGVLREYSVLTFGGQK